MRFDYVLADPDKTFLRELVKYHVSGQLRVAPEHVSDQVLHYMGKPSHQVYLRFLEEFDKADTTGTKGSVCQYLTSCPPILGVP